MPADRGQGCLCGVLRMASRWMETQKLRDLRENNISMKEMPSHAFHKGNRERTKYAILLHCRTFSSQHFRTILKVVEIIHD